MFSDYAGTFTGTVLQGDGPETLNYTFTVPQVGAYIMQLSVSSTSGTYQVEGWQKIQSVQSLGNLVITVPHWHSDNRVTYEEVRAMNTQCQSGALPGGGNATPPTVTSFTIRPADGAEIIMIRQT
ncbi:hypothetical protein [Streptomyces sp. NBC_01207]|uniref:hypothetical protein n=1 Tax=Streptomyces sp. NBC_01207 TaxID=2903772 RepID=UPI002E1196D6|nr:hypothetical protein OG457_49335 [Streptomyces sp. NBC_01207]